MTTLDKEHVSYERIAFAAATAKGFSDVAIISAGEAKGHGVLVDERTLEQLTSLTLGKTVPAYLTHYGANGDRLGTEIGMFSGFFRDGDKLRAQFSFLRSFMEQQPKLHTTLVELAKDYPDQLGISIVAYTRAAWPLSDGSEISDEGMRPEMALNALPSMRVLQVKSADFVQQPAANVGLFEAKPVDETNKQKPTMPADTIALSAHTEAINAKQAELVTLQAQHKDALAALAATHQLALTALQTQVNDLTGKLAQAQQDAQGKQTALAAMTNERDEALKYDMRKAGAPALEIALEQKHGATLPAPANSDAERWNQYGALCVEQKDARGVVTGHQETPAAKRFRELYLSRK